MSEYSYGTCSKCGARVSMEDGEPIEDTCDECGRRWRPFHKHTLLLTITAEVTYQSEDEDLSGQEIYDLRSSVEGCDALQSVEESLSEDYGLDAEVSLHKRTVSVKYLQSDPVEED